VLVEIKKPDTRLIEGPYRSEIGRLGKELIGGVSQIQEYCRRVIDHMGTKQENRPNSPVKTFSNIQPKGILVIGDTSELKGDDVGVTTFELFRRNMSNPEVITFDELYERARFIVGQSTKSG
jgi:hypothetical protein